MVGFKLGNAAGSLGVLVVVITHSETDDEIHFISMREAEKHETRQFFSHLRQHAPAAHRAKRCQPEFADALTQQLGKHRITIMLDGRVVRAYEARAGGRGYQKLINETLRLGLQADAAKDDLREVVRQVIREELRSN